MFYAAPGATLQLSPHGYEFNIITTNRTCNHCEQSPKDNGKHDEGMLPSEDRFDEFLKDFEGCRLDAILLCETWRPARNEIWEWHCGRILMGAGGFEKKQGVGTLLNKRWKRHIMRTEHVSERMSTTALKHLHRRIVLASVYFSHTGYADIHIEETYTF